MRKFAFYSLSVILLFLFAAGCAKSAAPGVKLGEEFTLPAGQSVLVPDENLRLQFVEVVADSRCPRNVVCIWAGNVSCLIEVTLTDGSAPAYRVVITQPGLTDQPASDIFSGYQAAFRVEPYPVAGSTIAPKDYRLIMTVTRAK